MVKVVLGEEIEWIVKQFSVTSGWKPFTEPRRVEVLNGGGFASSPKLKLVDVAIQRGT